MDYDHSRLHGRLDDKASAVSVAMGLEQGSGSLRLTHDKESGCAILS